EPSSAMITSPGSSFCFRTLSRQHSIAWGQLYVAMISEDAGMGGGVSWRKIMIIKQKYKKPVKTELLLYFHRSFYHRYQREMQYDQRRQHDPLFEGLDQGYSQQQKQEPQADHP